jgi:hypothetical protein
MAAEKPPNQAEKSTLLLAAKYRSERFAGA